MQRTQNRKDTAQLTFWWRDQTECDKAGSLNTPFGFMFHLNSNKKCCQYTLKVIICQTSEREIPA